ncbi:MAG: B12-binding domain-containing radical SAM protein, partial [Chloroflexi bacterium]|nr:B12-binding domain-containing radical SAM protein [Chloroflexota bacterium]
DWDNTWLEALLSRGDTRLGRVIYRVWRAGARFEAWSEHFRPELWRQALSEEGIDPESYIARPRAVDEMQPWDVIDVGVRRAFLLRERERAVAGDLSPDCSAQCHGCGVQVAFAAERAGLDPSHWRCPE